MWISLLREPIGYPNGRQSAGRRGAHEARDLRVYGQAGTQQRGIRSLGVDSEARYWPATTIYRVGRGRSTEAGFASGRKIEDEVEPGAIPRCSLHLKDGAHGFDQLAADRETEP